MLEKLCRLCYNRPMDILFENNNYVYSYRVGGIVVHNHKILLQKPLNEDYSIIGGHVEFLETTANALKREFKEELHAEIEIGNLMAVGEIFFPWGEKPCHQIALYYKVHLSDKNAIPLDGTFQGYDVCSGKKVNLRFCWIPLNELSNITLYPQELTPVILKNSDKTEHFVSNQLN